MADKKEKKASSGRKIPFAAKFSIFTLMMLGAVFYPTTVLLVVGMLPTIVAPLIDDRPQKTAWLTVGAMNFAGILPAWFQLWQVGHKLENAMVLIVDPSVLLMAYGGAAVGWIVYHQIPIAVAGILAMRSETRLKEIEKRQKELVRKWGAEVASDRQAK